MGRDDCSQPADKQDCPGPVDNFVGLVLGLYPLNAE